MNSVLQGRYGLRESRHFPGVRQRELWCAIAHLRIHLTYHSVENTCGVHGGFIPLSMRRSTFLISFVLAPTLAFGLFPNVIFWFLNGQEVVTNIIWGPVFGSGFWLSDHFLWTPGNGFRIVKIAGLLWAFLLVPVVLHFGSDWLWRNLSERGKKIALTILFASFLFVVPVRALMVLASRGIIIPDWALYIAAN
jgi:hypothetical protein